MATNEVFQQDSHQQLVPEDLTSERSDSANSNISSSGGSNSLQHFGYQQQQQQLHQHLQEAGKAQGPREEILRFVDFQATAVGLDQPIALDKPKDYAIVRNNNNNNNNSINNNNTHISDSINNNNAYEILDKDEASSSNRALQDSRHNVYNFSRDMRETRRKTLCPYSKSSTSLERSGANSKDLEIQMKNYGLDLNQMKDFRGLASRMGNINYDRLRIGQLNGESTSESDDLKVLQLRNPQIETTMAFERLRHSSQLFHGNDNGVIQIGPSHFSHAHQHVITQITQDHQQSQHQQHQQQTKSFSIESILGLRGGPPKDKQHRHNTFRKTHGHEVPNKRLIPYSRSSSATGNSCCVPSVPGSGVSDRPSSNKLKRVRTIFTAEQLEQLEWQFARQQYMVGPERLSLAHTLRLTEAQVKVWFQNRRIKWRKLNHEKQSQRLQGVAEQEDSNENAEWS